LTKRLWRMLPIALVIVLVVASAVFATEAPKALRPTVVTIEAVDGVDVTTGTFPRHYNSAMAAPLTEVTLTFGYTAPEDDPVDTIHARGQLLVGGVVKAQGAWKDLTNFGTRTGETVTVEIPADAADKALYTVRVEVQTRSTTEELSQFGSFADAVEIDKKGPGPVGNPAVKGGVPTKENWPTFTFTEPVDDGVGEVKATYEIKLTNSPDIPQLPETITPTRDLGDGEFEWDSDKKLEDADNWYFHIRGEDTLGNKGEWATFGPFTVDTTGPVLALTAPTHTNNPKPVVVVKATDLVGVDVTSGVFSITPAASGEGAWYGSEYRWTPTVDLANEDEAVTYTVTMTGVKDVLGNEQTDPVTPNTFVVDREAPYFGTTGLSAPYPRGWVTGTTTPQIGAYCYDYAPGELNTDPTSAYMWVSDVGRVSAGFSSNWLTWTPSANIGQGVKTVVVRVQDKAGNVSELTWTFTVDTIAPELELTSPEDGGWVTVLKPTLVITAKEEGSGLDLYDPTGSPKFTFSVKQGGTPVAGTGVWNGLAFTWTPDANLTDGLEYAVEMSGVKDYAGHTAAALIATFKVDSVAPEITVTPDDGDWIVDNSTTTIVATLAEDHSGIDPDSIAMTFNGAAVPESTDPPDPTLGYVYNSGAKTITYQPATPAKKLADGEYPATVKVADIAGNKAEMSWTFGIDTVEPKLEATSPGEWANVFRPAVVVTATEETSGLKVDADGKIEYDFVVEESGLLPPAQVDGVGAWDGLVFTWTPSRDLLEDRAYTVTMSGVADKAGNAAVNLWWTFQIDTKKPQITIEWPNRGDYTEGTPDIFAHVVDAGFSGIDASTIVMKIDGEPVVHDFGFADGEVSYVPAEDLADGMHTVTIDVKDNAGNAADPIDPAWTFLVDTTAPSVPTGLGVGNVADSGTWYINALLSTFRWNTSEDPDAPDGTPGSGLCCYDWEFGLKETLPEEGEDWVDALIDSYRMATPGADVEQLTIPFGLFGGLPAGVEYAFRVRANDDLLNGSDWSEPITFVYDPNPPTAVTNLMGDPNPENPYPNFSWTAATDAISGVAGYVIRIKTKGSASWDAFDKFVDFPDGATGTLAWQLKVKLDPGQYTMSIAAQDVAGNIGPAEQINFSVEAPSIVPVISVLKPTEGSYNINEISTVKFQVVDCYDEEIEVAVEGATLSHIVTIVDTPTLTQFYLLLDPQPGDLKITITVGEVTETFSYTVEAERSGFGFGRLRPW